ncbi:radical SAM protein [Spirochaetia bacterium]|nr:radical SAM protein [Spirochaetia bacterium]
MIYLAQPPFVQLNTPYPAIYYLRSFLEARGERTVVSDHSIGLFGRIFCEAGLARIFADARTVYTGRTFNNKNVIDNVERFLSEEALWRSCIDRLVAFLRGADREWGHFLSLANGTLPGGPRFDACLASMDGQPSPDAAPLLASKLLEDLADFITVTLDPAFALIKYAPSLAQTPGAGLRAFSAVVESMNGYMLRSFYRPFLDDEWTALENSIADEKLVIGCTIPFPGCLSGALVCAESAKRRFGERAVTVAGGGYVNTELRAMSDGRFFDYFDYLSFDRGYGSLEAILEHISTREEPAVYKTMYRSVIDGRIIKSADINDVDDGSDAPSRFQRTDREAVQRVFPDYTGVDFSRYIRPVDDVNPMHRLWSDGRWLKAYLAYGCYWHACAFCDVTLDYIRCFAPVEPEALFRHLVDQAEKTGVRGVHLVDEAAPVPSLLRLAERNRNAGLPLIFWGNIRYGTDCTPNTAALLAAGGLAGVSAGIEVATEQGFKRLGKGIGLREVVRSCAAFKEAGILTHGYLIYGYWDEDEQEILDSAEILRQLFAEGLLDSGFWHTFVLTCHSRVYAEWKRGRHPALKVIDEPPADASLFAYNDLSFEGEERYDRYTAPLDALLASWMAGNTADPVEAAFPFRVPRPSVSPDLVQSLLDEYARDRDEDRSAIPSCGRVVFLGSKPIVKTSARGPYLFWRWRLEDRRLRIVEAAAVPLSALLERVSSVSDYDAVVFYGELRTILGEGEVAAAWKVLRNGGLTVYGGYTGP